MSLHNVDTNLTDNLNLHNAEKFVSFRPLSVKLQTEYCRTYLVYWNDFLFFRQAIFCRTTHALEYNYRSSHSLKPLSNLSRKKEILLQQTVSKMQQTQTKQPTHLLCQIAAFIFLVKKYCPKSHFTPNAPNLLQCCHL